MGYRVSWLDGLCLGGGGGHWVSCGRVTAEGFQGLRQLTGGIGQSRRRSVRSIYGPGGVFGGAGPSGRWALVYTAAPEGVEMDALAEGVARILLQRYGVIFRDLMTRESVTVPWRE